MIHSWTLGPLAVSAGCFLWIWIANLRPRVSGVVWPKGLDLGGKLACPDLSYTSDVVLGCSGRFGTIQCRTLVIARGAEIVADSVVALRVRIDGELTVRDSLTAAKRVEVRGVLATEALRVPRIVLRARSRTTAITVSRGARVDRHPRAIAKGFFENREEIEVDDRTKPTITPPDTTDRIAIVR